jgi:dTDP-4-dehydrorhamnose 3,5-epimerase
VIFEEMRVAGAFLIKPERRSDDRGHFARLWCQKELSDRGLVARIEQINSGFSPASGTLRGMHYQEPPHSEVKIASCTRGAVFDVVVDLRRNSPSYRHWAGARLDAETGAMLYVPEGCAHGYLTLEDNSELVYLTSATYAPGSARGVRHDDPSFGIDWPSAVKVISTADKNWPDYRDDMAMTLT